MNIYEIYFYNGHTEPIYILADSIDQAYNKAKTIPIFSSIEIHSIKFVSDKVYKCTQ